MVEELVSGKSTGFTSSGDMEQMSNRDDPHCVKESDQHLWEYLFS